MSAVQKELHELTSREYKYGFVTDLETDVAPRGLNEDVIRLISSKKNEPQWLLDWRLQAYQHWLTLTEPSWQNAHYDPIDYQDIIYYAGPRWATWCGSPRSMPTRWDLRTRRSKKRRRKRGLLLWRR